MDSSPTNLKHSQLTDKINGVFYDVYDELGHGFLESTYAEAMVVALEEVGLLVFDSERKQIRENLRKSVAKVSA